MTHAYNKEVVFSAGDKLYGVEKRNIIGFD